MLGLEWREIGPFLQECVLREALAHVSLMLARVTYSTASRKAIIIFDTALDDVVTRLLATAKNC